MLGSSFACICAILLTPLDRVAAAKSVAATSSFPTRLYLADRRDPKEIEMDGGFIHRAASFLSTGYVSPYMPLKTHVDKPQRTYNPDKDPWISTTSNIEHLRSRMMLEKQLDKEEYYIYHIDTYGIERNFVNVWDEYQKRGRKMQDPERHRFEYATKQLIPFKNIEGWLKITPGCEYNLWHENHRHVKYLIRGPGTVVNT